MLADFVSSNRDAIIAGAQERVASRTAPKPSGVELKHGIPIFLDQLADALRLAQSSQVTDNEQMSKSAGKHGHELLRIGLTIGQVVHGYGDVCQTITTLAVEQKIPISTEDFRTLNLCLDDAIAGAVTTFSRLRERKMADQETERLAFHTEELRNLLFAAMLSFDMIKSGRVAVGGSTGLVLGRSLLGLRDLLDRSLTEGRLDAGIVTLELFSVADLIDEIEIGASLQAQVHDLRFSVTTVDRTVTVEGDRQILAAALSNLLQNAFRLTREHGAVALTVRTTDDRVLFEVQDQCGGLPPGKVEDLSSSLAHQGHEHPGLGLGLSICCKAALAFAGQVYVRDLPGEGCVFTLELPRKPPPPPSVSDGGKDSESPAPAPRLTSTTAPAR